MSARTETPTERFERLAAEFYAETGVLAPGKDDAAPTMPYEERLDLWRSWLGRERLAARSAPRPPQGEP